MGLQASRKSHIRGPEGVLCGVSSGRPFRDWTPHCLQSHWLSSAVSQEFRYYINTCTSSFCVTVFPHCLLILRMLKRWFRPCSCTGAAWVELQWSSSIKEADGCYLGRCTLSPKAAECGFVWRYCRPILRTSMASFIQMFISSSPFISICHLLFYFQDVLFYHFN